MKKTRICVVGCGAIANYMHGPSYLKCRAENTDIVLAGCCDTDETKAASFRKNFDFEKAYTDMEGMFKAEKPDALFLLSPVDSTFKLAGKILDMGLPLALEKPPGKTGEETLGLIRKAEKGNVPNMVLFNRRYSPLIRTLRELLDGFKTEEIQLIQYDMFRINRLDDDFATTAIHAVDAVKFISGSDYQEINFSYRDYPELGKNIADVSMFFTMKSGATGNINICPVTGINMERVTVNLLNHIFILEYPGTALSPSGRLVVINNNEITAEYNGKSMKDGDKPFEREGFFFENKHFLDMVMQGVKPSGDLASALQSVEVSECIRKRILKYPV